MPKVSAAHVEARKLQILEAACICFGQNGFHRSTMQEICKTAGLSPGAVYGYFSGKDELIRAILETSMARNAAIFEQLVAKPTIRESIAEMIRIFLEMVECSVARAPEPYNPHRIKVGLWAEAIRNAQLVDLLRDSYAAIIDAFATIVERGKQRGEVLETVDARAVAQLLLSLMEGYTLQRALEETVDPEPYFRAVEALLDGGLFVPAPGPAMKKGGRS